MPVLDLPFDASLPKWPNNGLVAILDLEFTTWDGSLQRSWSEPWEWREIVQIGMVLVDAGNSFSICDEFEILVQPQRNPILSEYFIALTGITQKQIEEEAVPFDKALAALVPFGDAADLIMFNGYDGQILQENCSFHAAALSWSVGRMFNFRPLLSRTLGRTINELVSSDLPSLAGVTLSGRCHSALHDCRAIAASFAAWREAGIL